MRADQMTPGEQYVCWANGNERRITVLDTATGTCPRGRVRVRFEEGILKGEEHCMPSRNVLYLCESPGSAVRTAGPLRPASPLRPAPARDEPKPSPQLPPPTQTIKVRATGEASSHWGDRIPIAPVNASEVIELDLAELDKVDPLLLCRIRAFIDFHCANGNPVQVVRPRSASLCRYLSLMRLAEDLPYGCSFDLGRTGDDDPRTTLLAIRRLRSPQEVRLLDDELAELLDKRMTGHVGRLAAAFTMTIGEMCDNATNHGQSDVGFAYVAAERTRQDRCFLAIGDLGIGIPAHMRNAYPELVADHDAIRAAARTGVTATGDPDRGMGYDHVIDTMTFTEVPVGDLRVWSGKGRFRTEVIRGEERQRRSWDVEQTTPGTWIGLELKGGPPGKKGLKT